MLCQCLCELSCVRALGIIGLIRLPSSVLTHIFADGEKGRDLVPLTSPDKLEEDAGWT